MKFLNYLAVSLLTLLTSALVAFAESPAVPSGGAADTQAAAAAPQQAGTLGMIFPFIVMFGIMYFLMIRPQQKKMKEQQSLLSALKHGDEVLTSSGILGKVTGITDKVVTLEIDSNVRVKMLKSQVSQVLKGGVLTDVTA